MGNCCVVSAEENPDKDKFPKQEGSNHQLSPKPSSTISASQHSLTKNPSLKQAGSNPQLSPKPSSTTSVSQHSLTKNPSLKQAGSNPQLSPKPSSTTSVSQHSLTKNPSLKQADSNHQLSPKPSSTISASQHSLTKTPSSKQEGSSHQLSPKPSSTISASQHSLTKSSSSMGRPATQVSSDVKTPDYSRKESSPSRRPSLTTPSQVSNAGQNEIHSLIRRANEDDIMQSVSQLSDEELKRLHVLLKKQRTTRASCPTILDEPLLSDEEMKKLGRVVRIERKVRWGSPSRSSSSSSLIKRHKRGQSSSSIWLPSSAEIESVLTKKPHLSSSSSIILEAFERKEHPDELKKIRSCTNLELCIYGVGPDVIVPIDEMLWDISGKFRLKLLRRWSSTDTLQVDEDYWLKNPSKPKKLIEDVMDELLVKWRKMDEGTLRFAYTEGDAGIISVGKEILARGHISIVKQARLIRPEQATDTAVKLIELDKLPAEYSFDRLRRELTIISALKHQNVIEVHCIFFYKKMLHILMKRAPNGTLLEYIRQNGELQEEKAKEWFWQLCEGLAYCHKEHIAHRDLTCENALLDVNYQIKITGFYLARLYKSTMPLCQRTCGTIEYAAPEVLSRKPYNPMKADLWSIGICFYVMLHGHPPFTEYQLKLYRLKEARKTLKQDKEDSQQSMQSIPRTKTVSSNEKISYADDSRLLVPQVKDSLSNGTRELLLEILQEEPLRRPSIYTLLKRY